MTKILTVIELEISSRNGIILIIISEKKTRNPGNKVIQKANKKTWRNIQWWIFNNRSGPLARYK